MPVWIIKAIIQKLISYLPQSHKINYWFQKNITKGVNLSEEYITDRLIHAKNHLKYYKQITGNDSPEKVYELGTGWYPIIPIYYFMMGAKDIVSIDIQSHVSEKQLKLAITKVCSIIDKPGFSFFFKSVDYQRIDYLKNLNLNIHRDEILKSLNIRLLIKDAQKTGFENQYFDLISSNNTFEHIESNTLRNILAEMKRIGSATCIHSHFVDLSDHFSHLDKSIGPFNFLKFSKKKWKTIDNNIQPQNRLRINSYRELFRSAGLKIEIEENRCGNPDEIYNLHVDSDFKRIAINDLIVSHSHIVARNKM